MLVLKPLGTSDEENNTGVLAEPQGSDAMATFADHRGFIDSWIELSVHISKDCAYCKMIASLAGGKENGSNSPVEFAFTL